MAEGTASPGLGSAPRTQGIPQPWRSFSASSATPRLPAQAAERIERIAADPATWLVVAELDGDVAGFGVLHVQNLVERDEPGVEVAGLVVGERFRRRGIGELLMQALEQEARARGGKTMVLNTAHRRADAHAFYEALGYEHTGRRYAKELT